MMCEIQSPTLDSYITSPETSSPSISSPNPPRSGYIVHSPSSEKSSSASETTAKQRTWTPACYRSPTESLSSFFSRLSRTSSSGSRVSGPLPGIRRKWSRPEIAERRLLDQVSESEPETEPETVPETEPEEVEVEEKVKVNEELSRSCIKVLMVFGLVFLVGFFVIWGSSRPLSPQVFLKSVSVNSFYLGEGSDLTGVPTKMLTINCSLKMRVHNPATFSGIHVSCSSINLKYYDLAIASGQLETYYQPEKSWRTVFVNIQGSNVPLYGAGPGVVVSDAHAQGVPFILDFEIRSQRDALVKSKHHQHITCSFSISSKTTRIVNFAADSCIYRSF